MKVEIAPMTVDDYPRVLALWQTCEDVGLANGGEPASIRRFLARNPGLSLTARVGEALAGAVPCGHDGRRGFLCHLACLQHATEVRDAATR